ncbi:MAG TPA: succinylglutamate desuccinylase/aspartoacylase family protein [Beijerinckiaceae bacterium]|nr:succinylglutamate desuccinylase/aspartoacylase family protein [Beijerinckiaceae bacterium]
MAERAPVKTRVFSSVDYEREGKQVGILRVPQVRDDSGWGVVQIPICVVRNGEGPTLLLTGGTHGDEYEGVLALMDLARDLDPKAIRGRVIVIPALHFPAAKAGRRTSPVDGKDLNRCFPGRPDGTFADILAHYVTNVLLPITDANLDLHSGGLGMDFVVSTTSHVLDDKEKQAETVRLAQAFGAPYHVVVHEVDATYTFMSTCERLGVTAISSELGGVARVSIPGVEATARGLRNTLIHYGMMDGEVAPSPTRLMTVPDYDAYAFAPVGGIYRPFHGLGARVEKGAPAGAIYSHDDPFRDPVTIRFGRSGELWSTRGPGYVSAGDPVAVVVTDFA